MAEAGRFALDLEFVSESRYVPELALLQVAWGPPEEPRVVAVDPLAADVGPLVEQVASPDVETVLHAAQGDLSVLAARAGIEGRAILDTQVAAAFAGLGEQVGYASLAEGLLGVEVDKQMQFTRWLDRPLSAQQLSYALDDVRHLPRIWRLLEERLADGDRRAWVVEESERIARAASQRPAPEAMYRRVGGWRRLDRRGQAALLSLAAWREEEALASNRPPSWILKNRTLTALARKRPASREELRQVDGVGEATVRRHGKAILAALRRGRSDPPADPRPSAAARTLGERLHRHLGERSQAQGAPLRFVATRSEADELAAWWLEGDRDSEPELPLLAGWRRQVFGEDALAWLREQAP